MGRPFDNELSEIPGTLNWIASSVMPTLTSRWIDRGRPSYCIGSGGSQSAADYLARLIRAHQGFAWATTPLEYLNLGPDSTSGSVFLMSASGRNKDILAAARMGMQREIPLLGALVCRRGSDLAQLLKGYAHGAVLELDVPSGKDGFLATNSLIAMMATLAAMAMPESFTSQLHTLTKVANEVTGCNFDGGFRPGDDLILIHAGWGGPAALDLESKLSEAALAPSMLCDIRNFGHGRHHWLAKRSANTVIVTLEDGRYRNLFDRTLKLLPSPRLVRLQSTQAGPLATLELTLKVFGLVRSIGKVMSIDPGQPGVPEFGRKIYHIAPPVRRPEADPSGRAARRKLELLPRADAGLLAKYVAAASTYRQALGALSIRGIVADYDGTLVNTIKRFQPLEVTMQAELRRLLEQGLHLGIATGRGKSVRETLRIALPMSVWERVHVGYYNGSQILGLQDERLPVAEPAPTDQLSPIFETLSRDPWLSSVGACVEHRPRQVSVSRAGCPIADLWGYVSRVLICQPGSAFKVVASTHSVDIIESDVTKLSLVSWLSAQILCATDQILAIGDSGLWPGNDCELLQHFPALSCGTTATDPVSSWNFAVEGFREADATLTYLRALLPNGKEGFSLSV